MAQLSPQELFLLKALEAREKVNPTQEWERGALLPVEKGSKDGTLRPAVPQIALDLLSALALPGDVYQGNVDPMGPEGLARAAGFPLAISMPGLAAGAPKVMAEGVDPNLLNIFAGPNSKTADLVNLARAETDMAKATRTWTGGKKGLSLEDAQSIFDQRGWFVGPDGKWRYEIPDNPQPKGNFPDLDAAFQEQYEKLVAKGYDDPVYSAQLASPTLSAGKIIPGGSYPAGTQDETVGSLIDHPELFAAYPDIADIPLYMTGHPLRAISGVHYPRGPSERISVEGPTNTDNISTLMHEIQHGVQDREGFGSGGNPEETAHLLSRIAPTADQQLLYPDPMLLYRALSGETEARAVQSRFELGTALDMPFTNIPYAPPVGAPYPKSQPGLQASGMYDIPFQFQLDRNALVGLPADFAMGSQGDEESALRAFELQQKLRLLAAAFEPKP